MSSLGDFIMDSDLARELGSMSSKEEPVNLAESAEDAARRYAGYLQRMEAAVKRFPIQRLKQIVAEPNYEGNLTDLVLGLLEELYQKEYAPGNLRTIEQAPSVHKAEKYPIPRSKDRSEDNG